jgi:hypothetical protein
MTKYTWFHDPRLDRSLAEVLTLEQVGNLDAETEAPTGASRLGRSRRRAVLSAASLVVTLSVGTALVLNGRPGRVPAGGDKHTGFDMRVAATGRVAQATEPAAGPVGKVEDSPIAPFGERAIAPKPQQLATLALKSPRVKLAYGQLPSRASIAKPRTRLTEAGDERTISFDRASVGVADAPLPPRAEPLSPTAPSAQFQISRLNADISLNPGLSSTELVHEKRSRRDSVDAMRLLRRQ